MRKKMEFIGEEREREKSEISPAGGNGDRILIKTKKKEGTLRNEKRIETRGEWRGSFGNLEGIPEERKRARARKRKRRERERKRRGV